MSDDETSPALAEWNWIPRYFDETGASLTFVRGFTTEQMIVAFGFPVESAVPMTCEETRSLPEAGQSPGRGPWVSFARSGDWAFAIEPGAIDLGMRPPPSADLAFVMWTAKPNYEVAYFENETCVTSFEPGMEWSLTGSDPERFRAQMREAGVVPTRRLTREQRRRLLAGERADQADDLPLGRVRSMLAFLTLIAGIRVSEEVVSGPLLTCQRRPA